MNSFFCFKLFSFFQEAALFFGYLWPQESKITGESREQHKLKKWPNKNHVFDGELFGWFSLTMEIKRENSFENKIYRKLTTVFPRLQNVRILFK